MHQEIPLSGGNATAGVMRVGATVRKPWTEYSPGVLDYMRILRERGIDLPAPLGQDDQGRMMTEFVPGPLAMNSSTLTRAQLGRVGAMVRAIHDASQGLDAEALRLGPALIPAAGADLVCHGDLTPWNLLTGTRWVFIDWDGASASTRIWDLAYAAQAFTLNDPEADPSDAAQDLRAFVDGYAADAGLRAELAVALPQRAGAMHALLENSHRDGREPWGSMYADFHGAHWEAVTRFLEHNEQIWANALTRG